MSLQGFSLGPLTYLTASNPVATNLLVSLTATAGTVDLCGAAGFPVGIADGAVAAASEGTFRPLRGRVQVISAGSIAAGDFVKAAAAGQVDVETSATTLSANTIGQAETAGTNPGDVFWMVCK